MVRRLEQYDYDISGEDGPLNVLQARSTNPNFPSMVAPPKGWVPLVLELDAKLAAIYPDYTISQVKEKFGGLRYYIGVYGKPASLPADRAADIANDLVREAERASYAICQVCGDSTVEHDLSWSVSLCASHVAERNLD